MKYNHPLFRWIPIFISLSLFSTMQSNANPVRDNAIGLKNFHDVYRNIHSRYENEVDPASVFEYAWKALYVKAATMLEELKPASEEVLAATYYPNSSSETIRDLYARKIQQTMTLVARSRPDDATPTVQELWISATHGLVGALHDPYSQFLPPKEHIRLQQVLSGEPDESRQFYGVGISVDWDTIGDEGILVVAPLPGTPAERNGIQAGDIIIGVNGEVFKGWEGTYAEKSERAIEMIKGEAGTTVTLTLKKKNSPEAIDITLERAPINPDMQISREMLDNEVGRITLSSFYATATEDVLEALIYLKMAGMKKLVFDLRFNPGGYLDQAVRIADIFLHKNDLITYTEGRSSPRKDFKDEYTSNDGFADMPMVILLNEYSASASEVVTGALKDNHRATVLGQKSFGKGSVQEVFNLLDEAGLRLTVAKYYTPSGICIHDIGIEPDVMVDPLPPEEYKKAREKDFANISHVQRLFKLDPQLKAAYDFLHLGSKYVAKTDKANLEEGRIPSGFVLEATGQAQAN